MTNAHFKLARTWLREWASETKVREVVDLGTGTTASIYGVVFETSRGTQRAVLRMLDVPVNLCLRESMVLNRLAKAGLSVPRCYGVKARPDQGCCMLLDWISGGTVGRPQDIQTYAHQMADVLAQIHSQPPMHGLPKYTTVLNRQLRQAAAVERLGDVVEVVSRERGKIENTMLLHGDLWPGNVLFKRKQLMGVVDWSDACVGPQLADVANTRMELAWMWGEQAMHLFTQRYFEKMTVRLSRGVHSLAYWDLAASLKPALYGQNWGLSDNALKRLEVSVARMQEAALNSVA
ncbi:MAG: aminoglycoside phosphotransferase family protein [Pseudomonadota bacterium]